MKIEAEVDEKQFGLLCNPAEAKVLFEVLNRLYCTIWTESCYDAYNEYTEKMCRKMLDDIQLANKILKFKR